MQANEEIEKYQKRIYSGTIAKCTFEINTDDGVISSPELDIQQPGIVLHFLRYGLFSKESYLKGNLTEVSYGVNVEMSPIYSNSDLYKYEQHLPNWKDLNGNAVSLQVGNEFMSARTNIENGYLYIVNWKGGTARILEYKTHNTHLYPIFWKDNLDSEGNYKDERSSQYKTVDAVIVPPNQTYYFAFSRVQLSIAFLEKITTNTNHIETRFVKQVIGDGFDYTDAFGEFNNDENSSYLEVHALFYNSEYISDSINNNSKPYLLNTKLSILGEKERCQNDATQKHNQKTGDSIENRLEDVFITLHDPISCMHDMADCYANKMGKFCHFVGKIQGSYKTNTQALDTDTKESNISKGSINSNVKARTANTHESLFNYASLAYQFVYNDNTNIEEYSNKISEDQYDSISSYTGESVDGRGFLQGGASLEKLEALLGVERRDELKSSLLMMRKDIIEFISSYYLHAFLFDYFDDISKRLVLRVDLLNTIKILYINVGDIDRSITLARKLIDEGKLKVDIQELIDYVFDYNGGDEASVPDYWIDRNTYGPLTTNDANLKTPFLYALTSSVKVDFDAIADKVDYGNLSWPLAPTATKYEAIVVNAIVVYAHYAEMFRIAQEFESNAAIPLEGWYKRYFNFCKSLNKNIETNGGIKFKFFKKEITIGGSRYFKIMNSPAFQGVLGIIEFHNALINLQTILSSEASMHDRGIGLLQVTKSTAGMALATHGMESHLFKALDRVKAVLEKYAGEQGKLIGTKMKDGLKGLVSAETFGGAFIIYNAASALIALMEGYAYSESRNKDSAALMYLSAGLFVIAAVSSGLVLGILILTIIAIQSLASYISESALQQIMHYSLIGSWSEEKKTLQYNLKEYKETPWKLNLFFRTNIKALTAYEYREDKTEALKYYGKKGLISVLFSPIVSGYNMYKAISDYDDYPNYEDIIYTHKYLVMFLANPLFNVKRSSNFYNQDLKVDWYTKAKIIYSDQLFIPDKDDIQIIAAQMITNNVTGNRRLSTDLQYSIDNHDNNEVELSFKLTQDKQYLNSLEVVNPYMHIAFRVVPKSNISIYNEGSFPFKNQQGENLYFYVRINLNANILFDFKKDGVKRSLISHSQLEKRVLLK